MQQSLKTQKQQIERHKTKPETSSLLDCSQKFQNNPKKMSAR